MMLNLRWKTDRQADSLHKLKKLEMYQIKVKK